LGKERIVLPGFFPLKIKNNEIFLYKKSFNLGQFPPVQSIKSELGTLLEKVHIKVYIDSKFIEVDNFQHSLIESASDRIIIKSTASSEEFVIKWYSTIEYDGFVDNFVEIIKSNPGVKIDKIETVYYVPASNNSQVIGFKAKGIRKQKNRNDLINTPYSGEFINALGFIDSRKSFWWFIEDPSDLADTNINNSTTIFKKNSKFVFSQIIADREFPSNRKTVRFGYFLTPIKNINPAWRKRRILYGNPSEEQRRLNSKFKIWWTDGLAYDAFPYVSYPEYSKSKLSIKDIRIYPGAKTNYEKILKYRYDYGIELLPYFSGHILSELDEVLLRYKKQWEVIPKKTFKDLMKPFSTHFDKPVLSHRAKGYSDYLIWRFSHIIDKLDINGVYLDHGPVINSSNSNHTDSPSIVSRYGGSLDIYGMRSFLKRLRTIFHVKGKEGFVFLHISNRELYPAYGFAFGLINGEQYRRSLTDANYLDIVDINEFRIRFASMPYGILTYWLPVEWTNHKDLKKWNGTEHQRTTYRKEKGLALIHDIPIWPQGSHKPERTKLIEKIDKYGIENAKFVGYWNSHNVFKSSDDRILISFYHRNLNEFLLIAYNTSKNDLKFNFSYNLNLKFKAENDHVKIRDNTILVDKLRGRDFILLNLTAKKNLRKVDG
jgi:hypothetical protein